MTFCARPSGLVYRVIDPLPLANVTIGGGSDGPLFIEWEFKTDGHVDESLYDNVQSTLLSKDWYIPTVAVSTAHWVRLSVTAGSDPNGADTLLKDTWYALTSNRKFQWTRTTAGTTTATVTFEIATDSGGSNIVATKSGLGVTLTYT